MSKNALDTLPQVSILDDEDITLKDVQDSMTEDMEAAYEELYGEELELADGDPWRILCNTCGGKIFQLMMIADARFKMNFIQYMFGPELKNWGANFGMNEDGTAAATVVLKFSIDEAMTQDITIPAGTRATAGDDIYFATDYETRIKAGDTSVVVSATCTTKGTDGNGYTAGQIDTIVDPINLVDSVENTTESSGGHDEYEDDERRELIYNFPSTYSSAGPVKAYEEFVKLYSSAIDGVKIIPNKEGGTVKIYIMLENSTIPSDEYCAKVLEYIEDLGNTPDTDKVEVYAPTKKEYSIELTYYIAESDRDMEADIKSRVEEVITAFVNDTTSNIGEALNPDVLIADLQAAGVKRAIIKNPVYQVIAENEIAFCTSRSITYGGLEAD